MSIALTNIRSGYDGFQLKDVTLEIAKGSLTALIGPNGCGNSTLLKTMSRELLPGGGDVCIAGQSLHKLSTKAVAKQVAVLPQHPVVPPGITIEQLVGYGRAPYLNVLGLRSPEDQTMIEAALETVQLVDKRHHLVSALSGGQRQRAFVAMCIAQDTPYVLFDEPTSFLDIRYQYEVLDLMQDLHHHGKTVVAVLHDIAQAARYATELVVMKDGGLYARGTPDTIVTDQMLAEVYGIAAQVYADPVTHTPAVAALRRDTPRAQQYKF
jgi:iron complex transport system ATP-binding protein